VTVTAIARLDLDPLDDRHYALPGTGSPSLIYVFSPDEQIGARARNADGRDLIPGSSHASLRLDFWAPVAEEIVRVGRHFDVWYGGTVGRGVIESIENDAS
jgi:hypothetical protein